MSRDTGVTAVTSVTEVQAGKGPARGSVLLGKYRVESTLGFGGMGLVIKAKNIQLDEDVAIKILREDVQLDTDNIKRFVREAKNAVRLKSEHVARIRDVGELENGRPYMVMELLEGLDLGKLLLDQGHVELQRAVDLVLQACDAIAEAHSLGIIHRDIKPTNLFVARRRDGSDLLKVLDFGISKAQMSPEMALTQTQSMLGTPAYMSPEQMRSARTVDPRSDIWSLGCVLYELVEGHQPFDADNFAELCVMVATEDPAPLGAGQPIGGVLARCLAKSTDERYQNIAEMAADLVPFASDPATAATHVLRLQRMIARSPESRDSTPLPMNRASNQRISDLAIPGIPGTPLPIPGTPPQTNLLPAAAPADTVHERRKGASPGKTIAMLIVMLAVGISAGLYVTRGGDDETVDKAMATGSDATTPAVVTPPLPAGPVDAGSHEVTTASGSDATGSAATHDAGSGAGSAKTVPHTQQLPPAKPPKKKPPVVVVKKPPGGTGSGAGSAASVKPPPKKCDPFDDPHGCKDQ